jgi:hypothetical protein
MNSVALLMTSHNTEGISGYLNIWLRLANHELCHFTDDVTHHCRDMQQVGATSHTQVDQCDHSCTVRVFRQKFTLEDAI